MITIKLQIWGYLASTLSQPNLFQRGIDNSTECTCISCEYGRSKKSDKLKSGRKKADTSGDKSQDNRSLDASRVEEINRMMKDLAKES